MKDVTKFARALLLFAAIMFANSALANMPSLTPTPNNRTVEACEKWAAEQDEDAIYMWGIMESGETLNSVGLKRLTLHCLGDMKPEIVGLGSSAGFDDAYCRKHGDQGVCKRNFVLEARPSGDNLAKSPDVGRPTFDCAKARWPPVAAMICASNDAQAADWDMAGAYWALYFSKFGRDRTAFRDRHVEWLDQLAVHCGRNPTKAGASDCVARAYRNRVGTYRGELRGDALAESKSPPRERFHIQEALTRLGHLDGQADGVFGASTRTAIINFQHSRGESATGFLTKNQKDELGVFESQQAENEYEAENDVPPVDPGMSNADTLPSTRRDCRIQNAGAFPDELIAAAAQATRSSQFPISSAGSLKSSFANSLRELAERASFERSSGKASARDPDAAPYYPVQFNATLDMERASPAELAACLPAFGQLLAEFEKSKTFQIAHSWLAQDERGLFKPLGQNGKVVGVVVLVCDKSQSSENLAATSPTLYSVIRLPNFRLVDTPGSGSVSDENVSVRVQAQIGVDGLALSSSDPAALNAVLASPRMKVWNQNGDQLLSITADAGLDKLYTAQFPEAARFQTSALPNEFVAACIGNTEPSEEVAGNSPLQDMTKSELQACRPKGNLEAVSDGYEMMLLRRKQLELCEKNFGGYSEDLEETRRMVSDFEIVLQESGPAGRAKILSAQDMLKFAEPFAALESRASGGYQRCESLSGMMSLVKSAMCQ